MSAETSVEPERGVLRDPWTLFLHQAAAVITTVVDFGTMILLVSLVGLRPGIATLLSALLGGIVNFTLARRFVFRRGESEGRSRAPAQGFRYALVSVASALWNAAGESLLTRAFGVPYVLARALVAVVVSLGWNYPLHRYFVFAHPKKASAT